MRNQGVRCVIVSPRPWNLDYMAVCIFFSSTLYNPFWGGRGLLSGSMVAELALLAALHGCQSLGLMSLAKCDSLGQFKGNSSRDLMQLHCKKRSFPGQSKGTAPGAEAASLRDALAVKPTAADPKTSSVQQQVSPDAPYAFL